MFSVIEMKSHLNDTATSGGSESDLLATFGWINIEDGLWPVAALCLSQNGVVVGALGQGGKQGRAG